MTTTAIATPSAPTTTTQRHAGRSHPGYDALVLAWRNGKHLVRVPSLIVFPLMTPVIFLLLFRYVLGGSIAIPGVSYANFLVPGILVQSIAFGATQTGVGLALDASQGIADRFRSLPISRTAVVAGRVVVDTGRNALLAVIVLGMGYAVGFRASGGPLGTLGAVGIAVAFGYAFSWVAAAIGLALQHAESVHDAGFIWVIPLTFVSSTLVAGGSMPAGIRWFARINPITSVADTARALALGQPAATSGLHAAAWIVGLLVVFVPLAVRTYQRR
jgi:ABC-2 type transport system permease protein